MTHPISVAGDQIDHGRRGVGGLPAIGIAGRTGRIGDRTVCHEPGRRVIAAGDLVVPLTQAVATTT